MLKGRNLLVSAAAAVVLALLIAGISCSNAAKKPERNQELYNKYKEEPTISLYVQETGEVKEIKMEEYLKGVVAAEMEPTWHQNALAAQAILARTFTLKKIEEGGVENRDVDASTNEEEFQAYNTSQINEKIKKAVDMTKGEVVTYKGKLINGWFHADGGGKTAASAMEGLNYKKEETPYIKSVNDPGAKITKEENKSWTFKIPLTEVREKINQRTGKDPGVVQDVKILSKGPSGRIKEVQINNTTFSGPDLRLALGKSEMRSTLVEEMIASDGNLVVKGKGYGHGVGMSQWGAKKLADDNKTPEEIVSYFFENVKVEKIWE